MASNGPFKIRYNSSDSSNMASVPEQGYIVQCKSSKS